VTERRERGFTLIELMIALVVSSLLVGLMLAIFLRLSFAYRSQQQVASVQQVLAAGGAALQLDAEHAGQYLGPRFAMPDGSHASIVIADSSNGPDQVAFFYGDPAVQAVVLAGAATKTKVQCDVDDATPFVIGDVVVMSTPVIAVNPANAFETITKYYACTLEVIAKTPTQLTFSTLAPWGSGGNAHCTDIAAPDAPASFNPTVTPNDLERIEPGGPPPPVPIIEGTRFYKLVARAYRIDPGRPGEGVLQVSPTGNLIGANDWRDLAYGFTDLQVASRYYVAGDAVDDDGDGDAERDWYSGPVQDVKTAINGPTDEPLEINISLVARTERDVEGIASTQTPTLLGAPANNNPLGNHDFVDLTITVDPTLQGPRIYRSTSFRVDLRNLGVGR
jgi:prepilin-type N-terminal cleavage/methylation domain-containing protein